MHLTLVLQWVLACVCMGFYLSSHVASVEIKHDGDFQCPGEQGYYPHPVNCEKYYGCWNERPALHTCPTPQLFDLKYHGCNWPELTDCDNRKRPDGDAYTKVPPPSPTVKPFDCPYDVADALYPDPSDCSSYYRCVYGTSYHYNCPATLYYNPAKNACDHQYNVNCSN